MKKFKVLFVGLLVLTFVFAAYAFTARQSPPVLKADCCCKNGACPMKGSETKDGECCDMPDCCCKKGDACPLKKHEK